MDEIHELQSQFMQLQRQKAAHKLSERVCVEILLKLLETKRLKVIYSLSGKEYITPKQLQREILDELFVAGGRINIVDLQPVLNVDLGHIEEQSKALVHNDRTIQLIQGELIANYYLDKVSEEINESLQVSGQLKLGDLSKRFGLSADYLAELVERRIARGVIKGRLEAPLLYTESFVEQHTALLRGIFSAITVPTPLSQLLPLFEFQESLFYCKYFGCHFPSLCN